MGSAFPKPCKKTGGEILLNGKNVQHTETKKRRQDEIRRCRAPRIGQSGISRSEYLRRIIIGVFHPTIQVTCHDDETLAAIGKLTSAYDRIGNNLNQIARRLNTYDEPYPELSEEVKNAISDLTDLKFKVLKTTGDAIGNIQTYQF